jgi:hypothetical protein
MKTATRSGGRFAFAVLQRRSGVVAAAIVIAAAVGIDIHVFHIVTIVAIIVRGGVE